LILTHNFNDTIGDVTPLSSHSQSSDNGDVARSPWKAEGPFYEDWEFHSSPPRVKNGEWRRFLVRRFSCKTFIFHVGSLLSPLEARFVWPSVWTKHKLLPHADSWVIPIIHSPFSTGLVGCHTFSMEKLSYWLLFFLILPFSIIWGGVTTPNVPIWMVSCRYYQYAMNNNQAKLTLHVRKNPYKKGHNAREISIPTFSIYSTIKQCYVRDTLLYYMIIPPPSLSLSPQIPSTQLTRSSNTNK
jgi:hypothetical protein